MADEQGQRPDSISSSSIISRPIQDPSVILHWMNTAPLILEIKEKLEGARYWKEMDDEGNLIETSFFVKGRIHREKTGVWAGPDE